MIMLLLSLYPKYSKKVKDGEKKYEFRKKINKFVKPGTLVAIWETRPKSEINCIFEIGIVDKGATTDLWEKYGKLSGITKEYFDTYFKGKGYGYAIEIKELWVLDSPIKMSMIREQLPSFNPPQSYYRLDTNLNFIHKLIKEEAPPQLLDRMKEKKLD